MATYPFNIHGACLSKDRNVFKVRFTKALSSVPSLRAYDNDQTFPQTGSLTTANYTVFQGSTANDNKPMLHFLDTSSAAPGTSNWYAESTIGVGVATCLMKGNDSYLQFRISSASMAVNNASVTWNALVVVPYDVNPTFTVTHDVTVRYTFTGSIPTVQFFANNEREGGTESVPVWGTITPDSLGVKFGAASATFDSVLASIPITGEAITRKAFVCQS